MPVTTLGVNKQSVKELLRSGVERPFLIPEYQRPYAWTIDQVDTLFTDIWDFTESKGGSERNATYFLGSIVAFINERGEQEIIDGQQRITSLFLLLRAIYTKLVGGAQTPESKNFISQIEECIWQTDKLTGKANHSEILIRSEVVTTDSSAVLREILENGKADEKAKDNYSQNYLRFQELYDAASANSPMMIYDFIYALLSQAILLPIMADDQDTALTIFSTLNDRGIPLSDADIFKAKIYKKTPDELKEDFIEKWKYLDERATSVGESIQKLFYYYMFYLRAKECDSNSTIPGVRKYFFTDNPQSLYEPKLMDDLSVILNLWVVIYKREKVEGETWTSNLEILRALDILSSYPNEFWKYPVINYYLSHRKKDGFDGLFLLFLHKLTACLLTRYLLSPNINTVKGDILKLDVEIVINTLPHFTFKDMDMAQLSTAIRTPNKNAVRMMLKTMAYMEDKQEGLLPVSWQIEHIFPRKWQANYFTDSPDEVIREKIEHIGNKIPFEKKLNIVAGNGYFGKKKESYVKSKIAIAKQMGNSPIQEWDLDNITERDIKTSDKLQQLMGQWDQAYKQAEEPKSTGQDPTPEQLEMIRKFKEKGWV